MASACKGHRGDGVPNDCRRELVARQTRSSFAILAVKQKRAIVLARKPWAPAVRSAHEAGVRRWRCKGVKSDPKRAFPFGHKWKAGAKCGRSPTAWPEDQSDPKLPGSKGFAMVATPRRSLCYLDRVESGTMAETRKLAAILVADVVGFSRLAGADEDRTLARLRALRSDLIDPTIAVHHGRVVKRTGDGAIVEFRSVVDAVRCAIEMQNAMVERNAGVPEDRASCSASAFISATSSRRADGDLMGDGVNIAARLEGIAKPGAICLSEDAYRQVKGRLDMAVTDLGPTQLKNIAEPIRAYSLRSASPRKRSRRNPCAVARRRRRGVSGSRRSPPRSRRCSLWSRAARGGSSTRTGPQASPRRRPPRRRGFRSSCCPSPISPAIRGRTTSSTP